MVVRNISPHRILSGAVTEALIPRASTTGNVDFMFGPAYMCM